MTDEPLPPGYVPSNAKPDANYAPNYSAPHQAPVDNLLSPQFIVAMAGLALVAGVMIGVFRYGSSELITSMCGIVIGTVLGSVVTFYLGSSAGGQRVTSKQAPDAH